jgi:hypothetical protein
MTLSKEDIIQEGFIMSGMRTTAMGLGKNETGFNSDFENDKKGIITKDQDWD